MIGLVPREMKSDIPLADAVNLSTVAGSFGARSYREARRHPGRFQRPVVGSDPEYYKRQANKVMTLAIKDDKNLGSLYEHAWLLNNNVESSITKPYALGGPAVASVLELITVTNEIAETLATKDLRVTVRNKWHQRAVEISEFALRVLDETNYVDRLSFLNGEPRQGLYPGLSENHPLNTNNYWDGLLGKLEPVQQPTQES